LLQAGSWLAEGAQSSGLGWGIWGLGGRGRRCAGSTRLPLDKAAAGTGGRPRGQGRRPRGQGRRPRGQGRRRGWIVGGALGKGAAAPGRTATVGRCGSSQPWPATVGWWRSSRPVRRRALKLLPEEARVGARQGMVGGGGQDPPAVFRRRAWGRGPAAQVGRRMRVGGGVGDE
jgi:hypothetical protein